MSGCECAACGRQMHNLSSVSGYQPSGGLAFSTGGHYGSTIFDPMDGSFLELCICDPCVERAIERGAVKRFRTVELRKVEEIEIEDDC